MKIEVHLQGGLRKIIDITPGATVGATIGRNVFNADGTLYVPQSSGGSSQLSITSWELILNIPPNVTALANTATTGLYTVTGAGTSATREIEPTLGRTTVSNGDGVSGNPVVDLAVVPDAGGGALLKIVRDMWGRITGTSSPTTDDLAEGATNLYFPEAPIDGTPYARQDAGWVAAGAIGNLDGGDATTIYGAVSPIDGGGA